jgi:hypothetical protein
MIAREEAIVRQAKMGFVVPANQEGVVLIERKDPAFIWASQDSEIHLHA